VNCTPREWGNAEVKLNILRRHRASALLASGSLAAMMALAGLAPPASASSSGWEAILGGHIRSAASANTIAAQAKKDGFKVHVQKITSTNYEAEIFNGGRTKAQAAAACA